MAGELRPDDFCPWNAQMTSAERQTHQRIREGQRRADLSGTSLLRFPASDPLSPPSVRAIFLPSVGSNSLSVSRAHRRRPGSGGSDRAAGRRGCRLLRLQLCAPVAASRRLSRVNGPGRRFCVHDVGRKSGFPAVAIPTLFVLLTADRAWSADPGRQSGVPPEKPPQFEPLSPGPYPPEAAEASSAGAISSKADTVLPQHFRTLLKE